jgi:hypothetical protein
MKKIFIIIFCLLLFWVKKVDGQITLDTVIYPSISFGDDFYIAQISESETKYVLLDTTNSTFSLYNLDFSFFIKDVELPEPLSYSSNSPMQPLYITRALFDCDSTNIEYAYYSPNGVNKKFRVMRTDGTTLLEIDSANGPYCIGSCLGFTDVIVPIRNTSEGTKLFLQQFKPSQKISIYSLCGKLLNNTFDFSSTNQFSSFIKVFPNPASNSISFQTNFPDNINEYELIIFDIDGKEIRNVKLKNNNVKYDLDVGYLNSGNYFYSLKHKNEIYKSGKFLLIK